MTAFHKAQTSQFTHLAAIQAGLKIKLELFQRFEPWEARLAQVVNNTSSSYGARNPTAVVVPAFMQVNDLEISQSNPSW